jgi:hypothetical protein
MVTPTYGTRTTMCRRSLPLMSVVAEYIECKALLDIDRDGYEVPAGEGGAGFATMERATSRCCRAYLGSLIPWKEVGICRITIRGITN